MQTNLKENTKKALKAAIGCCLAIGIAMILGLENSTSAGIITLLSLQNNKKETIVTAFQRLIAFFLALIISLILFKIIGYNLISLGIYLLVFVFVCNAFSIQNAIAMCTVLITHFWVKESTTPDFILNETLLLIIGAGIGVALNLFMTSQVSLIRKNQDIIDNRIKSILVNMSTSILENTKTNSSDLIGLKSDLVSIRKTTINSINNAITLNFSYFVEYLDMRKNQYSLLIRIDANINRLDSRPPQAQLLADFFRKIAMHFNECNNAEDLIKEAESIKEIFRNEPLPTTRDEFESRAILFLIFNEIESFLLLKSNFVQNLTEQQKKLFWKNVCEI